MCNLEKLKKVVTFTGVTLDEYLKTKHPNGKWHVQGNVFIFAYQEPNLSTETEYRWKYEDEKIHTVSGKTSKITPQFDYKQLAKEEAEREVDARELELKYLLDELLLEFEEAEAVKKVAEKFNITEEVVDEIYSRVLKFIQERIDKA